MTRLSAIWLLAIVVLVGAAACSDTSDLESRVATLEAELESRPPSAASASLPEYTVVERSIYAGDDKSGYYVTIVLFGQERETNLTRNCYDETVVGQLLSEDCR